MFKKVLLTIVVFILLCTTAFAEVDITEINFNTVTSGTFDQSLRGWINTINKDISNSGGTILANRGTGNVYYVDSATGSDSDLGTTLASALATIDAAVGKCTDNNGDVIYVVQGHAYTIDNGTSDAIDLDVAGITIVGLGYGTDAPELLYDTTTDELVFDADNVVLYNIRLLAGVSVVINAIEVKDGADNCAIINCVLPEPTTAGWEFIRGIVIVTADDLLILNCEQRTADQIGATNFIDNDSGVTTGLRVIGCTAIGEYSEGILHSDDEDLENFIAFNDFSNITTGQHAIEFDAAATGTLLGNTMYSDAWATILDPGSLKCFNNWGTIAIDEQAIQLPISASTATVTAVADGSVLERLEVIQGQTGGDDVATNFIGVDDASNLGTTSSVTLDADGSILERLEFIQQQFQVSKSITTIDSGTDGLFTIAGGPIQLVEIVTYIDTLIGSEACTFGYNINPTTPASDTLMGSDGTPLELNAAPAGAVLLWSHVLGADLTKVDNGAALSTGTDTVIIPVGAIEAFLVNDGVVSGAYTVYITYRPLAPGATVVAQ